MEAEGTETARQPDPDRELVEAAAGGDEEAFHALVRRHERRLFNFIRISTGGDAESEDLAQDVFIRAFRSLDRFRGGSSFKTWLFAIATNVVRTHLSRRPRWQVLRTMWSGRGRERDEDADEAPEPAARDGDLEQAIVQRDTIDRALASLAPDLRLVVTLRDVEGLDYREIAAALGVPIGTVESRLFRARQRLRPLLEPLLARTADRTRGRSEA